MNRSDKHPFISLWSWLAGFAGWSLLQKLSVLTLICAGISVFDGLVFVGLLANIFAFAAILLLGTIFLIQAKRRFKNHAL